VNYAVANGKSFDQLSLSEYQRFSRRFDDGVYSVSVASSLAARDIPGGTAPKRVARALAAARKKLTAKDREKKR